LFAVVESACVGGCGGKVVMRMVVSRFWGLFAVSRDEKLLVFARKVVLFVFCGGGSLDADIFAD
jgi:hypothetical protein